MKIIMERYYLIDGKDVRQQASDKENIRKKPNSGHINPNKKN